jgi:protein farnesyltransferase/geranylgeranyltransferase type-1 subunit alpha
MLADELSPRCLRLTAAVIDINPAHYTVWLFRFRIVRALGIPVAREILWLNEVALQHLKNYQIWHHRQSLLDLALARDLPGEEEAEGRTARAALAASEMAFLKTMLAEDAKNYHVWSYRHLLVRRLGLWPSASPASPLGDAELAATMEFIAADVRNNSAWAHRFYLVFSDPAVATTTPAPLPALARDPRVPADLVAREVALALDHIRRAPQNQSAWGYLRGALARGGRPLADVADAVAKEFASDDSGEDGRPASSHAVEVLADHAESVGDAAAAARYWDQLMVLDPVRGGYWEYRKAAVAAPAA